MDDAFEEAARVVKGADPSNADKLKLYALFKSASGAPLGSRPGGLLNVVAQAKWDARSALGECTVEDAKRRYIALVQKICPEWDGADFAVAADADADGRDEDDEEDDDLSDPGFPVREVEQALFNRSLAFYRRHRSQVDCRLLGRETERGGKVPRGKAPHPSVLAPSLPPSLPPSPPSPTTAALLADEVLELYSCYKMVTVGACAASRPG